MDAWDKFLEASIKGNRKAKRQSREDEIHALENSGKISNSLIQQILDREREYREILDSEIKDHRDWLIERKGG